MVKLSSLFQSNLLENSCLEDLVTTSFKEMARQSALLLSTVKEKLKYKLLSTAAVCIHMWHSTGE